MTKHGKSALLQVIGGSPRAKVLDFLLTYSGLDYSKTQVARETGISRATMEKLWRELEKQGFVKKTRRIGNAELYALNTASPEVQALAQLDHALAKAKSTKEFEKQTVKTPAKQKSLFGSSKWLRKADLSDVRDHSDHEF